MTMINSIKGISSTFDGVARSIPFFLKKKNAFSKRTFSNSPKQGWVPLLVTSTGGTSRSIIDWFHLLIDWSSILNSSNSTGNDNQSNQSRGWRHPGGLTSSAFPWERSRRWARKTGKQRDFLLSTEPTGGTTRSQDRKTRCSHPRKTNNSNP